jgi:hypothetical protein
VTQEPTGGVGEMVGSVVRQSDGVVWRQQGGGDAVTHTWARKSICRVGSGPSGPWAVQARVREWPQPFQFCDGPTLFHAGWPT